MRTVARTGFTLAEVMVASLVLVFGIVSALGALQAGVKAMDRARQLGLATQLLQGELEQLRLRNWTQLEALAGGGGPVAFAPDAAAGAGAGRYRCTRTITDLKTDMKEIVLTAEWRGADGRTQTARLITRYARHGLNDYLSTGR